MDRQCRGHDTAPELGEILFVAMTGLFDQAVGTQAFQPVRSAGGRETGDVRVTVQILTG
jgi:hypothetical protein